MFIFRDGGNLYWLRSATSIGFNILSDGEVEDRVYQTSKIYSIRKSILSLSFLSDLSRLMVYIHLYPMIQTQDQPNVIYTETKLTPKTLGIKYMVQY